MSVDYLSVLKTAEEFTNDDTPWDEKFRNLVSKPIKEQADAFKLRFALQLEKQGVDAKEVVAKVNACADMFVEKAKSSNGKNLKYGGVEFGSILEEFVPNVKLSFVERKAKFKDFDLDNNGVIDLVEFLLFLYKDQILAGHLARHGLDALPEGMTEAEALIKEFVNISVLVDTKLDGVVLGMANIKASFESDMQKLKDEAKSEVQKRQLTNNLKAREAKYEEEKNAFPRQEQIEKLKVKLMKTQENHLRKLEEQIVAENAEALQPKKNLVMP